MPEASLYVITALLYAALALHAWSGSWLAGVRGNGTAQAVNHLAWQRFAIPIALVLHGALLYQSLFRADGLYMGLSTAISLIVWLTVLVYWLGSLIHQFAALQALILPIAAVCVLIPVVLPQPRPLTYATSPAFTAHLIISMLAYSLFTIAALHALLMSALEKRLHRGTLPAILKDLPPLMAMEALLFKIILAGFILLTFTLISGVFFSEALFGRPLTFQHKTVFGFISWGVFGALLAGHKIYGWRGRTATRWTLIGFVLLLLAYVGSKFVLEVILHRA
jgi:ABC-type uncharacterized transport system permease subunit